MSDSGPSKISDPSSIADSHPRTMFYSDPSTLKNATERDFWDVEPRICEPLEDFLDNCRKERKTLQSCLESMRTLLEGQLRDNDIKCVVTARVKDLDSLRKRLYEKVEDMDHKRQCMTDHKLSDSPFTIWGLTKYHFDVLGLRIALYFPEELGKVLKLFDDETGSFQRKAVFSMKNGGRSYVHVDGRERDRANSGTDGGIAETVTGGNNTLHLWSSRGSVAANDAITDHKIAFEKRFRGYTEEHRYVSFRSEREALPKPFDELWVEIQVRSVIMDAYINISHGLEYKALTGVLSDQENQILESINGLAQTGEVILQHLQYIHQRRVQSDAKILRPQEIVSVITDYMKSADSGRHYSDTRDPQYVLQELVLSSGCNTPGNLKRLLKFYKVKEDYSSEFDDICRDVASVNSLQTYILYKVLQDIQESQIKRLFEKSDWARHPRPYWEYICAILEWFCAFALDKDPAFNILEGESRDVLSEGLAMLLCIFVQTYPNKLSCTPSGHSLKASNCAGLILTLMSRREFKRPYAIIALFGALFERFGCFGCFGRFGRFCNYSQLPDKCIHSVCVHLAKNPASLRRGIKNFVEARIRDVKDPSEENESSETMRRILRYLAVLDFDSFLRLLTSEDSVEGALDFPLAYNSLHGLDELRKDETVNFRPWLEFDGASKAWCHLKTLHSASEHVAEQVVEHVDPRITFLSLDLMYQFPVPPSTLSELSDLLQCSADIITIKSLFVSANMNKKIWGMEKIRFDYIAAEGRFEGPMSSQTIFVKKSRFLSTGAEKLLELGPVWEVKLPSPYLHALVCDLFLRSNETGGFTRLRLPNLYSSHKIARAGLGNLLPSTQQWIIREGGPHTGTHQNALSNRELLQALITGRMRDEHTPSFSYPKLFLEFTPVEGAPLESS